MPRLKIEDVPPFDGEYALELLERPLNGWELHIIKKLAGLRPGEFEDALDNSDYDFVIALTVVALLRDGKIERRNFRDAADVLLEAESGKLSMLEDEPAGSGAVVPPESEPAAGSDDSGSSEPSGTASNGHSGRPESIPTPTGAPG